MQTVRHTNRTFGKVIKVAFLLSCLLGHGAYAENDNASAAALANKLYKVLTGGIPLLPTNPLYSLIVSRVKDKDYLGAAAVITDPKNGADEFYNNTVASLAIPMNREGTTTGDWNDLAALFLVIARDSRPLTDLMTADIATYDPSQPVKYAVDDSRCNGSPSYCNTEHFHDVWANANPKKVLTVGGHPGFPGVGLYTTYTWGINFDYMGTQRRNIKGTMENLYCVTMDSMRTTLLPDIGIRRDVPRDDPDFNTNCKRCHSWMDLWVHPFLAKNVTTAADPPAFTFQWKSPSDDKFDKMNNPVGPEYPVTTTAFDFFYTDDQNRVLGIDPSELPVQSYSSTGVYYIHGENLRDFANIVANSLGFYRCMTKRIVTQIYLKQHFSFATLSLDDFDKLNGQSDTIEAFAKVLKANKDLADIYRRIAVWYVFNQ